MSSAMLDIAGRVKSWHGPGEKALLGVLLPHVRSATADNSSAVLYEAFHSLFAYTLPSTCPAPLSAASLAQFCRKLLDSLPSSSTDNAPDVATRNAILEILIDVAWSADAEIEDNISDAIAIERAHQQQQQKGQDVDMSTDASSDRLATAKAKRAKADTDRAALAAVIQQLIHLNVLPLAMCRARLDFALLVLVGALPNRQLVEKKEVQTKTRLFYRQNKFNLLREQSEGYTKLTVEIIASIGPPHGVDALPAETAEQTNARASETWDKIVSLIGYFDLDPNRVLDIILDVFSQNLVTHYTFFFALLRCSPWGGDRGKAGQPADSSTMDVDPEGSQYSGLSFDNVLRVAQGLPPQDDDDDAMEVDEKKPEASDCAQIMGFKISYYTSNNKEVPKALSLLAAMLIRERIMTLEDILPHLLPNDDEMQQDREKFDKYILDKISNARASALAMAAPLADEGTIKPRTTADAKKEQDADAEKKIVPVVQPNQRVRLLQALLTVGALEPAFKMLSHAPWLVSASSEIAEPLLRIAHRSLNPLYEAGVTRHSRYHAAVMGAKAKYSPTAGLVPAPAKKLSLTTWAPTPPSTALLEFVFFYPAWKDWIPLCTKPSDVKDVLEPILRFIGVQIYRDTEFMTKLCRVGKAQLTRPGVQPETVDLWVQICRLYLLPGMSLLNNNTTISAEIWPILRSVDAATRWSLYGEWATQMYKAYPEMRVRKVEAEREAKAIMRRLSTKTVMTLNRNVAKLAHSNPCILFSHMVNQVQSYDNMAEVVVESLKFCALMPFDVLLYTVLEVFADPDKQRLKEDGTSVSQWLQSLSSFTGSLCRRYNQVDSSLILRYVVNRLREDQVQEIIVLRELISKMTGMQPPENLSEQQILALSGGPILRIEAVASETRGVLLEKSHLQGRATERLVQGLSSQGLAKALLVLTARQRNTCVFTMNQVQHLKALSTLYDSVQQVHFLLVECLSTGLAPSVYSNFLPSFGELCGKYGVDPYTAMQIYRPKLHHDIVTHIMASKSADAKESAEEAERRLKAALAAKREPAAAGAPDAKVTPTPNGEKPEKVKEEKPAATTPAEGAGEDAEPSPWLPLLEPVIKDAKDVLGHPVAALMGAPFFVTFWQLTLYDLKPPAKRYDEERARHRTLLKQTSDAINDPTTKSARVRELKVRKDRIAVSNDALTKEYATMVANREFTIKRLAREKLHWFANASDRTTEVVSQILQHCILPRAVISPMDADYCAQFIKALHMQGTPNFHTLRVYDRIFHNCNGSLLHACSDNEARNLGRFLRTVLQDLRAWVAHDSKFLEEVVKGTTSLLPGFQMSWSAKATIAPGDVLDKDTLKKLLRKWHSKLCGGLTGCIASGEYMQVYNAIIILNQVLPVFPRLDVSNATGTVIHECVKKHLSTEKREDLKILSQTYLQHLNKDEALWKPAEAKPRPTNGAPATAPPASSTPQRSNAPTTPRPQAPAPAPASQTSAAESKPANTPSIIDSIPRPEVVKRVVRTGADGSPKPDAAPSGREEKRPETPAKNGPPVPTRPSGAQSLPGKPDPSPRTAPSGTQPAPQRQPAAQAPPPPPHRKEPPLSPRGHRQPDDPKSSNQAMPPPVAPSSTVAAQDMRSRAVRDERDRNDPRTTGRSSTSSRPHSPSSSSRRPSPSRGSGRTSTDASASRPDDRSREADRGRPHPDPPAKPAPRDRDGRDSHENRESRESRDRPSGRSRDDDRSSDDRPRDRERHHTHESRDREHSGREARPSAPARPEDEARGESSRRPSGSTTQEETLGKRRRHADDDPTDRSSKRSSGSSRHDKDGSSGHREERSRHRRDKDRSDKEKDRDRRESSDKRGHRKDRETREEVERDRESRPVEPSEKPVDKAPRPSESSAANSGAKPAVVPPSGPRAMAAQEPPRANRTEAPPPPPSASTSRPTEASRGSDRPPPTGPAAQAPSAPAQPSGPPSVPAQPSGPPSVPAQPSGPPSVPAQPSGPPPAPATTSLKDRLGGFGSPSTPDRNRTPTKDNKDDTPTESRKRGRGSSSREADSESGNPPNKRMKIQRQRYPVDASQLDKQH